jgi:tRNA threonylcarbamoyladenosine biosynthesis protein TsaE
MKITVTTNSLEETQKLAKDWLSSLPQKTDEATIVGLYGNLGSGKTTFTQAVARELGIKSAVTSPTFVIEKLYETTHPYFARLIHIDAYRLESGGELQTLNFEDLVDNPNNLILIEWPENVKEILPENHLKIACEFVDENSRRFEVQ